jgi:hypothetical protein
VPTPPSQPYGESTRPIEIDESEEVERLLSLKHRETLVRGMGIVDMCHRMLFGTTGTMANLPLTNNGIATSQGQQHHSMVSADHSFIYLTIFRDY